MIAAFHRRVQAMERRVPVAASAPVFIMAADAAEAERQVAAIRAEHPDHRGTLFVMIGGRPTPQTEDA